MDRDLCVQKLSKAPEMRFYWKFLKKMPTDFLNDLCKLVDRLANSIIEKEDEVEKCYCEIADKDKTIVELSTKQVEIKLDLLIEKFEHNSWMIEHTKPQIEKIIELYNQLK